MSEQRTTITRAWRPTGTPARRHDDFIEIGGANATTRTLTPAPLKVVPARRAEDIARRLENWGWWAKAKEGKGADCMTGAICDRARRAAVGNLLAGPLDDERINNVDAERINSAFVKLPEVHRHILLWTYVEGMKEGVVAKACGFPRHEYGVRLAEAQNAIESWAGKYLELRR